MNSVIRKVDKLIAALCEDRNRYLPDAYVLPVDAVSHARIRAIVPQFVEDESDGNTALTLDPNGIAMLRELVGDVSESKCNRCGGDDFHEELRELHRQSEDDNTIRAIYEREIGYDTNHITAWLIEHEYDGLVNTETDSCGCGIENLAPCGHIEGDCKLGFRHRDGLMYEKPEEK